MSIFNLPDLGEGLPDAEIVRWYVQEGDTVQIDAPIVAMETAKAVVDVPAPISGTITKLHGKAGDIIKTGAALVEFAEEFSVKSHKRPDTGTVAGALQTSDAIISERTSSVGGNTKHSAKITPAVRALAQRMHVDLNQVTPTGPNNTITSKDIEQAAQHLSQAGELELLKGVRRTMAQTMQLHNAEVVPVTVVDDAILQNYDAKLDITIKIMQAIVAASKLEPALNAWYDGHAVGRRLIKQVDLGVAMDSEDGLFVPVIRDVGNKDAQTLRVELNEIKAQVANRTIKPEDMRGSSFVLSNFGKFAGRYASPLVVPPSVGILAVGTMRDVLIPVNGAAVVAKAIPMSLSFDHRACTGGEASRFLGAILDFMQK